MKRPVSYANNKDKLKFVTKISWRKSPKIIFKDVLRLRIIKLINHIGILFFNYYLYFAKFKAVPIFSPFFL